MSARRSSGPTNAVAHVSAAARAGSAARADQGGARGRPRGRRGEAVGVVGEIGLRQDHARPPAAASRCRRAAGASCSTGSDARTAAAGRRSARCAARMQMVFQDPYGSLDPRRRVGEQIADGILIHGLADRRDGARARRRAAAPGRARSRPCRPLAARILRRPASAHRHRARARDRARFHRRGRAGLGARRLGAGADACELLAELRAAARSRAAVHQPRPARRAASVRPRVVMYLGRVVEEGPTRRRYSARRAHPYTRALHRRDAIDPARALARAASCPASCRARPRRRPAACFARAVPMRFRPAPKAFRRCARLRQAGALPACVTTWWRSMREVGAGAARASQHLERARRLWAAGRRGRAPRGPRRQARTSSRGPVLAHVLERRGLRDHDHAVLPQQPGERDLRRRRVVAARDLLQRGDGAAAGPARSANRP